MPAARPVWIVSTIVLQMQSVLKIAEGKKMNDEIHIVSLIIYCAPGYTNSIIKQASALPHSECHYEQGINKIILLLEAESGARITGYIEEINAWHGVLTAQLCYHHCESSESLQEELHNEVQ